MGFEHIKNADCTHCSKRFTNVFCNPAYDSVAEINKEKVCTAYKKGEYIFKEGTRPHGVFCVNVGKIKLVKSGDDGREHILRLVKPGDPLGYRSMLSGDKYNASAIALENCGVCFIPKELFLGILQKDSQLSFEMMKLLSDDLKKAEMQLTHLAQKPVRERVAEAILFIKETYGYEEDGQTINATFSREDIANIVGTAKETTIRLLSEFNKDKIIQLTGKKITILDLPKLVSSANITD
ncbi:Crp/Fnr family transcriptional regulator [Ferruginibacter sp. HRS2-29]|uniref:Crp/Fnr family transcriptional regulator n=1 Tax=Ferruginibacter sp. HRS2-29 TaxID=2487334 RepID=UPI0020CEB709|nr:Crp/Fnr family transcriptional regulator [Ferruginibacter sp. HRS2-29]MCP9752985.1 Crp/Fnr family transcriptional regulator [Ferruginibacter sp. HRS2-29]